RRGGGSCAPRSSSGCAPTAASRRWNGPGAGSATLRGTDPDGTQFRLDEPELLLWVHCAEIGSYADIARRAGIPLARGELDTFVDEQRRAAAVVGLDPAQVPRSVADPACHPGPPGTRPPPSSARGRRGT